LSKLADLIEANIEEFSALEALNVGEFLVFVRLVKVIHAWLQAKP
jgi:hypothetical protein